MPQTYLIQWIGRNDGGFYRTLGPAFDQELLEKGEFYFCHQPETSDHFETPEKAREVLALLKELRPDYDMIVVTAPNG